MDESGMFKVEIFSPDKKQKWAEYMIAAANKLMACEEGLTRWGVDRGGVVRATRMVSDEEKRSLIS